MLAESIPVMMEMTSWRAVSESWISRATSANICGLTARITMSAPRTARAFPW